ncbi:MAG: hypothetical protein CXT75_12100 [Methanobacteriota archaeon]|nr:MAG: hypothetical protein CXT75_12100 [Euryarchaeota archaeon]
MVGWAMVQKGEKSEELWPITFRSKVLDEAEINYPIGQLEQLAIVLGYRDNYYLLHGFHTIIYCDNKPSVDRATKTENNFITILGDLVNCTRAKVEFRPGKEMGCSDFLSRY